jgi:hypothetical protein
MRIALALVAILAAGAAATRERPRKVMWWLAIAISAADQVDGIRLGHGYRPRDPDLYIGLVVLLAFVAASYPLLRDRRTCGDIGKS